MTTVRDIIRSSLRLIGVVASGETPEASEENDALQTLNDMVDLWATQNLMIYELKRELFSTTSGTQAYTLGPTGTWVTTVTTNVHSMSTIQSGNVELPMQEWSVGDWQNQVVKGATSSLPTAFYVEHTWPNRTVSIWPVPASNGQVALYYKKQIAEFADLDATIELPNGYRQALRFNLAVMLSPEYGKQLDQATVDLARSSLAWVKRSNIDPDYMRSDYGVPTTGGSYNNRTGPF